MLTILLATGALAADLPWMNSKLTPDERADLIERQMTLDEKLTLLHGPIGVPFYAAPKPGGAVGSAGFVPGIARLGIPALQESDASLGVTDPVNARPDEGGTAMPSGLALASTFDPGLAFESGALIGKEAFSQRLNVMLAGGANLARDPRNGRNFEYLGEDPLLAGTLAGESVRGIQSQHVISTIKHFALNDQETLRETLSAKISEAAARESDLLAFQIAIERGQPGAVMCAYNRVNGPYACENDWLLYQVLKRDWQFPGWVMSDWGAVHGLAAATNGLDQQSGQQLDKAVFFGAPLKDAAAMGDVPQSRIDDMAHRVLRSMFAVGLFDHPAKSMPVDFKANAKVAQEVAAKGIVLLKNDHGILPLSKGARRIALIGGYANFGVISGGGSSQVYPADGQVLRVPLQGGAQVRAWDYKVFDQSSPVTAIRTAAPQTQVDFDGGEYWSAAAETARGADAAIVFVTQWMTEGLDAPDLSLPNGQDQLIEAVATANPNTIVVLETGGPVLMPWLSKVRGVIEAWYPGIGGGDAIAQVLFGDVNPSGKLPMTFPASVKQLPRPNVPGAGLPPDAKIDVDYNIEGSDVGYRWFSRKHLKPLFPFGYGLSYTQFAFSKLSVQGGNTVSATLTVSNKGTRAGSETAQLYLVNAAGKEMKRLLGFQKLDLKPRESRTITITADRRLLAHYDEATHQWRIDRGQYRVAAGNSSVDTALTASVKLDAAQF